MQVKRTTAARRLRRYVRRGSDRSVELLAPLKLTPDIMIVGAQRCGTTSMFKALVQHPDVARPFLRKGVHYFDKNYDRGFDWYVGHFPTAVSSRLRRRGRSVHTIESSPYYMFHPLAPGRIARDLEGARLVVMLRDPVTRAYSAHSHELARGFEDLAFEEALEAEPERLRGERERMVEDPTYQSRSWQHHAYVTRGEYIDQLLGLEKLFGRDRICVVDSQAFFEDPAPVFSEVLDTLGLASRHDVRFEKHNARSRDPLPPALRRRLDDHFTTYDERLEEWWGRTPSWRLR
jgi:hypothetical protein